MFNFLKTQKDDFTARLTPERNLAQAISEAKIESLTSITKLTIVGTMTKADFKFICKKLSKSLQELDISNASWEEKKLRRGAFARCIGLNSVTLPNWITEISDCAFSHCISLKSVTIPQSVTEIGDLAFWGCVGLYSVVIPDSVTAIGFRAFNNTGLTSVQIPNSVVKIGGNAFGWCVDLATVTLPDSLVEIGNGAFSGCTGLTAIDIPKSVTKIGEWIFEGCELFVTVHPDNPFYASIDGKLVMKN